MALKVKDLVLDHISKLAGGQRPILGKNYEEAVENIDEECMRIYLWGSPEPRKPCTAFIDTVEGNTKSKKFPTKFLWTLIHHMVKCEDCFRTYRNWFDLRGFPDFLKLG